MRHKILRIRNRSFPLMGNLILDSPANFELRRQFPSVFVGIVSMGVFVFLMPNKSPRRLSDLPNLYLDFIFSFPNVNVFRIRHPQPPAHAQDYPEKAREVVELRSISRPRINVFLNLEYFHIHSPCLNSDTCSKYSTKSLKLHHIPAHGLQFPG